MQQLKVTKLKPGSSSELRYEYRSSRPASAAFLGHEQRISSEVDQLGDEPEPKWNASVTGGGLVSCFTELPSTGCDFISIYSHVFWRQVTLKATEILKNIRSSRCSERPYNRFYGEADFLKKIEKKV